MSIYYIDGDSLRSVPIADDSELTEAPLDVQISTLIDMISAGEGIPEGGGRLLQNDVYIESYFRDGNIVCINLNGDYGSIKSPQKLFLVGGIVKTLCQADGVDALLFTIQGEPLLDPAGAEYGLLSDEDFIIHNGQDINNYINTEMTLYFADMSGTKLKSVKRQVHYNRNKQPELAVIEELIKGPLTATEQSILPSTLKIAGVTVKDDTCYVNFDVDALRVLSGTNMKLATESIVQSLYSVCGTKKVQFQINGDSDITFEDGTDFDRIYTPKKRT